MKIIVLAAGYATRLYPLTLTQPKPNLPVAGKPLIEHVLDNLAYIEGIDRAYIVTNAKFVDHFYKWRDGYRPKARFDFTIVNDRSTDDSNKLGAIGDLHLVLKQEAVDDDIIVVAGDNLFSQSLAPFGELCRAKKAPVVGVFDVGSLAEVSKYSSIHVDPQDGHIVRFEEKPKQPTSTLIGIALYYYPKETLPLIDRYIAEGNNHDQPGRLVQWLYPRTPVYTWQVPGVWFDIGSKETLAEANRVFGNMPKDT